MSDNPPERRRGTTELGERMARIEAGQSTAAAEIVRVRDRLHYMESSIAALVSSSEDAHLTRGEIHRKLETLAAQQQPAALLAVTVATHIEQCKTDKAEIKTDVGRIKRTIYIATGLAIAASFVLANLQTIERLLR